MPSAAALSAGAVAPKCPDRGRNPLDAQSDTSARQRSQPFPASTAALRSVEHQVRIPAHR